MSQPVKLIALLKAAPGMSREEFGRRWIEGHARVALLQTLLVTRETVMRDKDEALG